MGDLIDDELIETIAVVGEPDQVAAKVRARLAGISDSVSLVNNRAPDPEHLAEVVAGLHGPGQASGDQR
jgi:alkanesulfonate monooxygenase SsuD/methylene tetrahydromethanopterin reductase-like flavin-dependent oxidoreductase (luciferase family)